jgi:hypothetical protein
MAHCPHALLCKSRAQMPPRPPAQAAPPMERQPAPRRDRPVDDSFGEELHHRTHPVPDLDRITGHAGRVKRVFRSSRMPIRFPAMLRTPRAAERTVGPLALKAQAKGPNGSSVSASVASRLERTPWIGRN